VSHYHAVVWLDHSEAHVLHFTPEEVEKAMIQAKEPHKHLHAKHTLHEKHHGDGGFYHQIAAALNGAHEILITGPGSAKLELVKHIHAHDHALVPSLVAVETVDHPSDGQLLAYARKYFKAADRMR
jgi:stalled ribosome rescue protein Dom34